MKDCPPCEIANRTYLDAERRILRFAPELPFPEWAEENITLPDGAPFRWLPYQRAIASDMFEPGVAELYLRLFSGFGKTFTLGAGFAYAIYEHGLTCGAMFPNLKDGVEWLEDELKPVIGRDKKVDGKDRFHVQGIRATRDIAGYVKFANNARIRVFGQSFGSIRRAQLDIAFADEIDALDESKTAEGDRLRAWFGRTRQRKMQRHWAASYPSIIGKSRIDDCVDISQSLWWLFTCLQCGRLWKPHTSHIGYETDSANDVSEAWITCPSCSERFNDAERRQMSTDAEWMVQGDTADEWHPDDPEKRRIYRAYSSSCMIQLGRHDDNYRDYIHEIASRVHAVKSSKNPAGSRRVIANQLDGESWKDESDPKPAVADVILRRERYEASIILPEGVRAITAGVDPNKRFLSIEIVGYGENEESWGLHYEDVHGFILDDSTWAKLDTILHRQFLHPCGLKIPISLTAIDSRYKSKTVRLFCAQRSSRGVFPIVGSNTLGTPFIGPKNKCNQTGVTVRTVGVNEGKDTIYQRLDLDRDPETGRAPQGYPHYPVSDCYGKAYFDGLLSEDSELKKGPDGDYYPAYSKINENDRNEPLDCRNYANFAATLLSVNFERVAAKHREYRLTNNQTDEQDQTTQPRHRPAPEESRPAAQKRPTAKKRRRRGGSFVIG